MIRCGVRHCGYVAESSFTDLGDFPVCPLHDAKNTRRILELYQQPAAYWFNDRPIVQPCGDLLEEHLAHVESASIIHVEDCSLLAEVPEGRGMVYPLFDLIEDR